MQISMNEHEQNAKLKKSSSACICTEASWKAHPKSVSWDVGTKICTFNLYQYHSRRKKKRCYIQAGAHTPKHQHLKYRVTFSREEARAPMVGVGVGGWEWGSLTLSISGLTEATKPPGVSVRGHWSTSVSTERLKQVSQEATGRWTW